MQHHLFLLLSLFETPQDTTLLLSGSKTGRTYGGVCSDRFNSLFNWLTRKTTTFTRQPTLILLKFFDLFGILLGRPHFHKNRTDTVQMIKDGAIWVNI
mgnify:CR=1 FL=1